MAPSTPLGMLGAVLGSRAVDGLQLRRISYRPEVAIPWHEHEHANFSFVLAGTYLEVIGRRERLCSPGMVLIHPAGEGHRNRHGPDAVDLLTVEVPALRLEALGVPRGVFGGSSEICGGRLSDIGRRLARGLDAADASAPLALGALVCEALALQTRLAEPSYARRPRWLDVVVERLRAEPASGGGLPELAALAGVHPAHLARTFRRFEGCSVGDYLRACRIEHARRGMEAIDRSLSDVAADAGFADQSHFCRAFRSAVGRTPGEYRRALGGGATRAPARGS